MKIDKTKKLYNSLILILYLIIWFTVSSCEYCMIPCFTPIPYGLGETDEIIAEKINKAGETDETVIRSYSNIKAYQIATPEGPRSTEIFNKYSFYISDRTGAKYKLNFLQNDYNIRTLFKSVNNSENWICIQYTASTKKVKFFFFNKFKLLSKNSLKPFSINTFGYKSFESSFQLSDQDDYLKFFDASGDFYCYFPYKNIIQKGVFPKCQ